MPVVALYNVKGEQVGEIELNEKVFAAEINQSLIHDVVVMQNANKRQGTAATKTRGLVSGGGRKPWRQKGTGRARAGSIRSPIWVGGGTAFGPTPRSYNYTMPKKARRAALRSALSAKLASEDIMVIDSLEISGPKTKEIADILKNLGVAGKAMLIIGQYDSSIYLSSRNIQGVKSSPAKEINVSDVMNYGKLIFTKEAVEKIEEVLS